MTTTTLMLQMRIKMQRMILLPETRSRMKPTTLMLQMRSKMQRRTQILISMQNMKRSQMKTTRGLMMKVAGYL